MLSRNSSLARITHGNTSPEADTQEEERRGCEAHTPQWDTPSKNGYTAAKLTSQVQADLGKAAGAKYVHRHTINVEVRAAGLALREQEGHLVWASPP